MFTPLSIEHGRLLEKEAKHLQKTTNELESALRFHFLLKACQLKVRFHYHDNSPGYLAIFEREKGTSIWGDLSPDMPSALQNLIDKVSTIIADHLQK